MQSRYAHATQQLRGSYKVMHNLEDLPEGLPKDTRSFSSYPGSDTFKVDIAEQLSGCFLLFAFNGDSLLCGLGGFAAFRQRHNLGLGGTGGS